MKSRILVLIAMLGVVAASAALIAAPAQAAKTPDAYISEAQALVQAGKLADAVTLLQQGIVEHPTSSDVYTYLGLYTGQSAGQAQNFMEAGRLTTECFTLLDKAVELGPQNPTAYFYRGLMGVKVPVFLGKLPGGINDLKQVIALSEKAPGAVPNELVIPAYSLLGEGYEAAKNPVDARATYEKLIKLAPGTDAAKKAEERLAALGPATPKERPKFLERKPSDPAAITAFKSRIEAEPKNAAVYLDLARALMAAQRNEEAREVLHAHNEVDPSNPEAYRLLFQAVGALANVGYDPKIAEDTRYRTNLAFESMSAAEKVVELAPNDLEARLARGITGVSMPFFVGKFDQGIADLEHVLKHTKSSADSAQAMFWLGAARQRQGMKYWLEVATKHPETEAARLSLDAMKQVERPLDLGALAKPAVVIDFVLGFRDELAPQTAVWIEDAAGKHVKTVFVTGFAGNVKGKQVTLPVWAEISNFEGADAVTGASIDVGHYMHAWDCTDAAGKPVKPGTYTVKVEVAHWPSMKYQLAETPVTIDKKGGTTRVEEGDYIPSLVVTYYPK